MVEACFRIHCAYITLFVFMILCILCIFMIISYLFIYVGKAHKAEIRHIMRKICFCFNVILIRF